MSTRADTVLPDCDTNPYYIYAPCYTRASAGIRVLHLLCHWLNRKGQRAYIVPFQDETHYTNLDLLTPLLTPEIEFHHFENGNVPIVLYPEVIPGNPLGGQKVARYVLNYPGLLGGETEYNPKELVWLYSQHLAKETDRCDGVLHMPVIDEKIFNSGTGLVRSGSVYYASKFKNLHKQKVFGIPSDSIEITRDLPDSPQPHEIAEMLQKAEYFYCFENTALATEAVLCGCPAVFVPNQFLKHPIAVEELGWDGFAWGTAPDELSRAKATVSRALFNYRQTVSEFFTQLERFIAATQYFSRQPLEGVRTRLNMQSLPGRKEKQSLASVILRFFGFA
jgi:hypothetical protein